MTSNEQRALEQQLVEAEELREKILSSGFEEQYQAYLRLKDNPDFQTVMMDTYCGTEIVRFNELLATPNYTVGENAESMALSVRMSMRGAAEFKEWFRNREFIHMESLRQLESIANRINSVNDKLKG